MLLGVEFKSGQGKYDISKSTVETFLSDFDTYCCVLLFDFQCSLKLS